MIKGEIRMKMKKLWNVFAIAGVTYVGYLTMKALWDIDVLRNVGELMKDE